MSTAPFTDQVTFIYVDDTAGAWAFYADVLGLPLVRDQGACRIYRSGPGACIGICERLPGRPEGPPAVTLTLITDDVAGWHDRLVARGVEIASPLGHSKAFKVMSFLLKGPEGHRIEIQRFDDPLSD